MTRVGHRTVLVISNDFNMRSLQPSSEVCCPLQVGHRMGLDAPKDCIFVVRVSQVRRNRVATVDTQSLPQTNQCSHSRNQTSEYVIEPKAHYNPINSERRSQELKRKQKLLRVDRNMVWWVTYLSSKCRDLNLDPQNPCQSGYVWSPTSTSSTLLVRYRQGLQSKLAR